MDFCESVAEYLEKSLAALQSELAIVDDYRWHFRTAKTEADMEKWGVPLVDHKLRLAQLFLEHIRRGNELVAMFTAPDQDAEAEDRTPDQVAADYARMRGDE